MQYAKISWSYWIREKNMLSKLWWMDPLTLFFGSTVTDASVVLRKLKDLLMGETQRNYIQKSCR